MLFLTNFPASIGGVPDFLSALSHINIIKMLSRGRKSETIKLTPPIKSWKPAKYKNIGIKITDNRLIQPAMERSYSIILLEFSPTAIYELIKDKNPKIPISAKIAGGKRPINPDTASSETSPDNPKMPKTKTA